MLPLSQSCAFSVSSPSEQEPDTIDYPEVIEESGGLAPAASAAPGGSASAASAAPGGSASAAPASESEAIGGLAPVTSEAPEQIDDDYDASQFLHSLIAPRAPQPGLTQFLHSLLGVEAPEPGPLPEPGLLPNGEIDDLG